MNKIAQVMQDDELMKAAPAIFADKPFIGMSENYKFIPTIEVVNTMRSNGFFPVLASQSKTRCLAKQGMQRHMIKFRQEQYIGEPAVVGQEVPEIVLVNSHDGSSLYELMLGIFRFVCGNGMVVMSQDFGSYQVKHNGMIDDLIEATFHVVADFPKAFEQVERMKEIVLNPVRQLQFAERAMLIKSPEESTVAPSLLLEARREDDETTNGERSLWNTFNVVQENLIRGGLEGLSITDVSLPSQPALYATKERKTKTRPIKAVQEDLRINKALWSLASENLAIAA